MSNWMWLNTDDLMDLHRVPKSAIPPDQTATADSVFHPPMMKPPSIFELKRTALNGDAVYLYSAQFHPIRKTVIFMTASTGMGVQAIAECYLCADSLSQCTRSPAQFYARDGRGEMYDAMAFECPIPTFKPTHAILFSRQSQSIPTSLDEMYKIRGVHPDDYHKPQRSIDAQNLTDIDLHNTSAPLQLHLCQGPVYNNESVSYYAEWIEYQFMMGVSQITFYIAMDPNYNTSPTRAFLQDYARLDHRVRTFDFPNLPLTVMHYLSQNVILPHCMLESIEADYVATWDYDEFIGPAESHHAQNYFQLAPQAFASGAGEIRFSTWFTDRTCMPDHVPGSEVVGGIDVALQSEHAIYKRTTMEGGRYKYFYRPECVRWPGIHHVYGWEQYAAVHDVSPSVGFIHHMTYYYPTKPCTNETPADKARDTALRRFSDELRQRVVDALTRLLAFRHGW